MLILHAHYGIELDDESNNFSKFQLLLKPLSMFLIFLIVTSNGIYMYQYIKKCFINEFL